MRWKLRGHFEDYEISDDGSGRSTGEPRWLDRDSARRLVNELLHDEFNHFTLKSIAYDLSGPPGSSAGDGALVDRLTSALSSPFLRIERVNRQVRWRAGPSAEPVPVAPREEQRARSRFELQLVDDETDKPIAGVELELRPPGGGKLRQKTNGKGMVELQDVEPGSFGVESRIEGAELATCYRAQASGGQPAAWESWVQRAPAEQKAKRFVAQLTSHRVRAGETLEGIAWRYNLTLSALAKFNFGTDDPAQVNDALRDRVGCSRLDADGKTWLFSDGDEPGIVYIPSPWQTSGLSDGQSHVVRLRALALHTERIESTIALDELAELAGLMEEGEFLVWITLLFGAEIPEQAYRDLRSALVGGSFRNPEIRLVDGGLDGHAGAYDRESRSIRVSRALARSAREDKGDAWKLFLVLVAEFGHHLDHVLRNEYSKVGGDAPLDEGVRLGYSLVNLDWGNEKRAKFATYVDDQGERALEVEFEGLNEAIQKYLNREEEERDEKLGNLEFFGAGRGTGKAWSYGHEKIEDSLAQADFDFNQRRYVYFGNWLRDNSQIVDPKVTRRPDEPWKWDNAWRFKRETLTKLMDVMARQEFRDTPEFRVTPKRLGLYRNEEHIDNPKGMEDGRSRDPDFNGACQPFQLAVNPATHMKRYMRSSGMVGGRDPSDYRVKDGDTLDGLARGVGLTWQQLAQHNFGTSVPEEVNRHLREKVGCTRMVGQNYVFTSQDQPGIIHIPGATGTLGPEQPDTAFGYTARSLRAAVREGRTPEGYRLLGQGLHTLEDYYAHTNFVEVALCHLGHPVEPWVPRKPISTQLPITSGTFGGLDTAMSLSYVVVEQLTKERECIAGKETAGSKIMLILLEDMEWNKTRDYLGGAGEWVRNIEKEYPRVAEFTCNTIGVVIRAIKFGFGVFLGAGASLIDDAQTAFLQDRTNNDNPTHSQLAKDHDDHPLHVLACELAAGASRDVGQTIQRAWKGAATADDVVLAASRYLVHPADIRAGSGAAWVMEKIAKWGGDPANNRALSRMSSPSYALDWSKAQMKHLQDLYKSVQESAGGPAASSAEKTLKGTQAGGRKS